MRRHLSTLFLVLVLAASAAGPAPAAPPPDPDAPELSPSERLEALFERVKLEQEQLRSLEARFVQLKESEMFVQPETARGRFSFVAPDRVRWEYLEPNPMTVLIDEDTMTTWYRDLRRAEVMRVGRYSDQVLKYLGASGSLDALLDYFRVKVRFPDDSEAPYRMTLDPRYPRIAKRIEAMDVWIDRERFVPVRLRYTEPDGDSTELRFSDLEINADIPADRFDLDLPDDVERRVVSADQTSR